MQPNTPAQTPTPQTNPLPPYQPGDQAALQRQSSSVPSGVYPNPSGRDQPGSPMSSNATNSEPIKKGKGLDMDSIIILIFAIFGGIGPGLLIAGIILLVKGLIQKKSLSLKKGIACTIIGILVIVVLVLYL
jgi:hypothetical protein